MSTAVAKKDEKAEVAVVDPATAAIMAAQEDELGEASFRTPILKLCQSQTKEVKDGDAEAGEFLNTLTGDSYGTKIEFIVAYFQRGRAASLPDGRYLVAVSEDLIPANWADLVGEEFVGTRFDEYPDAHEQYARRVNEGEIEKWGSGPKISTTYNYTGLVLPSGAAAEDEEEALPVRISFLRSTKEAHDKIDSLKRGTSLRRKPFWEVTFELESKNKSFGRNDSFIVNVRKGRNTTDEEKQLAVQLATAVMAGRTSSNDEAGGDGPREAPDAKGGLAV
jgi:hypothetical protein